MHNFLYSLTICLLHYYPRHGSSINMPIFIRKNCIHTTSGIFALCKRLHSTLVDSGLNKENCALKLVDEIILYYDAWSKKHKMQFFKYFFDVYTVTLCRYKARCSSGNRTVSWYGSSTIYCMTSQVVLLIFNQYSFPLLHYRIRTTSFLWRICGLRVYEILVVVRRCECTVLLNRERTSV